MSGDEVFALIVSLIIGIWGWRGWFSGVFLVRTHKQGGWIKSAAIVVTLLAAALMLFVLVQWSSHDVRSSLTYICFYTAMWFGWLGAAQLLLPFLGLSARDDVFERRNSAAGVAIGGLLIGITLAFAGGNIGDGPGWWVVIFSSGLSTGTLFVLWMVGHSFSQVTEAITVDRDVAAGWRAAGYFVGGGLITGRAAAGNWQSASATIGDFLSKGWPVLIVWGFAVGLDIILRPSPEKPTRSAIGCGLFPATLLVAAGLMAALSQGAW